MNISEITIILPTRNERVNIAGFLASLDPAVELIAVDDSSDGTAELIARLRPVRTRAVRSRTTVTEARQLGCGLATSPWVLFCDADIIFPPGYFRQLALLEGADVYYGPKLSRDRYRTYYRLFAAGQGLFHALGLPAASGSNLLVHRHAVQNIGGFDVSLRCNEDSELVWRLAHAGYRVRFCPGLPVYATDHRRLDSGVVLKTAHTLARCSLLRAGLLGKRQRASDWGYWRARPDWRGESPSRGTIRHQPREV